MSEAIFNLMFYSGIREGELLALTLKDFNEEGLSLKQITISKV